MLEKGEMREFNGFGFILLQERLDLMITYSWQVFIVFVSAVEIMCFHQAHQLIRHRGDLLTCLHGSDGHSNNNPGGILFSDMLQARQHSISGFEAVVNQDNRSRH